MKWNRGLVEESFSRIAAVQKEQIRKCAQDIEDIDEENDGRPKVSSVEKYASSSSSGNAIDYDTFIQITNPAELFDSPPLSVEEVLEYVKEHYNTDLEDEIQSTMEKYKHRDPNPTPVLDMDYLESAIQSGSIGRSDNTYNYSWWGPTVQYTILGPSEIEGESYAECVLLVSMHRGGDIRGNYSIPAAFKLDSYADEAPWYDYSLQVRISTDKGMIKMSSEGDEAYNFYVYEDETGTFEQDSVISVKDLDAKLNWEEAGSRGIW